jgi:predicted DNA binding CopG/RHH family protein
MEKQDNNTSEFRQLLTGLLDGQLDGDQLRQLEQKIRTDPEAMKQYVEMMTLTVGLRKYSQTQRESVRETMQEPLAKSTLWQTLADDEKQAPTIKFKKRRKWFRWKRTVIQIRPKEKNIERVHRHVSRLPISTLVVASAALVLLLVYIRVFPLHTMATLNDSINASWDNRLNEFREGKGLYPISRPQTLKEGFAQVRFTSGAEVVFEAPCQFVLEDKDQMFLQKGKVYVKVPKEAIGFSVRTPNCRIIDLGTEFGVSVNDDGSSQLQMFLGKASLISGLVGRAKINEELIFAGQARSVEAKTGKTTVSAFLRNQFVQRIDSAAKEIWRGEKSLSLVDMVSGGNGLQANIRGCLSPTTGVIESQSRYLTPEEKINPPASYVSVPTSDFIDGTFVPNGKSQVSSKGHRFAFPRTSGTIWYPITAVTYYVTDKNEGSSQSPGEGVTPRPAFYLHSNLGITFDLNAVRRAYPNLKITGFRSQCGIRWEGVAHYNKVDFWAIVDGQCRYENRAKIADQKMDDVFIPLADTDRFLTLATTEADDGLWYDWGMFVNPIIEMEPK